MKNKRDKDRKKKGQKSDERQSPGYKTLVKIFFHIYIYLYQRPASSSISFLYLAKSLVCVYTYIHVAGKIPPAIFHLSVIQAHPKTTKYIIFIFLSSLFLLLFYNSPNKLIHYSTQQSYLFQLGYPACSFHDFLPFNFLLNTHDSMYNFLCNLKNIKIQTKKKNQNKIEIFIPNCFFLVSKKIRGFFFKTSSKCKYYMRRKRYTKYVLIFFLFFFFSFT